MGQNIYEMVTNQIIKKLERGVVPWKKPFRQGMAVNWKTQKAYRGINTVLLDGGVKKIKTLVNRNQYSKNVRNFLHGQYTFPSNIEELAAFQHTKTSFDLLRLDEDTVLLLDEYVRRAKARGYNKANRSLIMRHVLAQFLKQLDEKSQESTKRIRRIPFYFQEGTSETLYYYISASDRNPMINQFILDEYKPSNDTNKLRIRPTKTERFTVGLEEESIQRMDRFVEEIGVKGVTRTALMRDAVDQLIESLSTSTSNKIIVEQRLEASIKEYKKHSCNEEI